MDFLFKEALASSASFPAALPRKLLSSSEGGGIGGGGDLSSSQIAFYAVMCILFVVGSGLAAGLTLGLMSLDKIEMEVLLRSGTAEQQKLARRVLPLISDPHWLLVTLLLVNAGCFEALPIFLDVLVSPAIAIVISVTLILIFGEILPQAVCARHGLRIGAALGPLVILFKWLFSPIAWPMARVLDWLLGKEGYTMFKRNQLKALVDLHGADEGLGGKLSDDEVQIICGALDLTNKVAFGAMTPLDKVVMLSTEQLIDPPTVAFVLASGHSRIPVYAGDNREHVVGLLLVKELLKVVPVIPDPEAPRAEPVLVSTLNLRPIPRLPANTPMYSLLKLFQTGRAHMVVLTQPEVEDPSHHQPQQQGQPQQPAALPAPPAGGDGSTRGARRAPRGGASNGNALQATPGAAAGKEVKSASGVHIVTIDGAQAPSPFIAAAATADTEVVQPKRMDTEGTSDEKTPMVQSTVHVPGASPPRDQGQAGHLANGTDGAGHEDAGATPMGLISRASQPLAAGLSRISQKLRRKKRRSSGAPSSSSSSSSSGSSSDEEEDEVVPVHVPQIAQPGAPIGIITIEDVLEELMGQEILDETDAFADNDQTITVDEEMRAQLALRLPEALREVVIANATPGTIRRLSRTPLSRKSDSRPPERQLQRGRSAVGSGQALVQLAPPASMLGPAPPAPEVLVVMSQLPGSPRAG